MPRSFAAMAALTTFALLPLVLMASKQSPGRPWLST